MLGYLPLGFNDLMHGCLRTLCAGYGLYAVGNTVLLILLYFTDYQGALGAAAAFAVLAGGGTALSLRLDPAFYGFGFRWIFHRQGRTGGKNGGHRLPSAG